MRISVIYTKKKCGLKCAKYIKRIKIGKSNENLKIPEVLNHIVESSKTLEKF